MFENEAVGALVVEEVAELNREREQAVKSNVSNLVRNILQTQSEIRTLQEALAVQQKELRELEGPTTATIEEVMSNG